VRALIWIALDERNGSWRAYGDFNAIVEKDLAELMRQVGD
jgi:hypothetical protein